MGNRGHDIWFGVGLIGAILLVASLDPQTTRGLLAMIGLATMAIAGIVIKLRSKP